MRKLLELLARYPFFRRLALEEPKGRIPVVRQLTSADCGAAALNMVLRYYGSGVSLEEVKKTMGVGATGVTAESILRTGRTYGLRGRGVSMDLEHLGDLAPGAILHW